MRLGALAGERHLFLGPDSGVRNVPPWTLSRETALGGLPGCWAARPPPCQAGLSLVISQSAGGTVSWLWFFQRLSALMRSLQLSGLQLISVSGFPAESELFLILSSFPPRPPLRRDLQGRLVQGAALPLLSAAATPALWWAMAGWQGRVLRVHEPQPEPQPLALCLRTR